MHILEQMAISSSSKIKEPYIYEKYFPLNFDKYVCVNPFDSQGNNYKYWEEVIQLLLPHFKKMGIYFLQIGNKKIRSLPNCIDITEQADINQQAYLIKNSLGYLGIDNYALSLASFYKKIIVGIYSRNFPSNSYPFWSEKKDYSLIFPKTDAKPSFSDHDPLDLINKIKPEEICQPFLNLFDKKIKLKFKTIFIGKDYLNKTLEFVLDKDINPHQIPIDNPIIRMDYYFDEQRLINFLKYKKAIIFTDKIISHSIIQSLKPNILHIVYLIKEDNNPNFIKRLKELGISYTMISYLDNDVLNKYKIQYMDYGLIISKTINKNINIPYSDFYYKSSRSIASGTDTYPTEKDWLNKNKNNLTDKIDDLLLKDIDNLFIFTLDT